MHWTFFVIIGFIGLLSFVITVMWSRTIEREYNKLFETHKLDEDLKLRDDDENR